MADYDDQLVWWHGQLDPELTERLTDMLVAWHEYAQHRKKIAHEQMTRARKYAAMEAKNAEKNQKQMIGWVTFRRWENFVRDAKKEKMKKNPHLYADDGEQTAAPQVVWEPKGPVGNFYSLHEPKMPRKRPTVKKANLAQPSIVIVKTQINRKFKTPVGSPALRSVPGTLMGRHGMHQFVDKQRLQYANQMWRYRTNPVANNASTATRGTWVTQSAALGSLTSTDLEAGLMPPPYASVTSNQSASGEAGVTTAGYTIRYADIPVTTTGVPGAENSEADPREEDAEQKRKPEPPLDPKASRQVRGTKTVRRMYRRKFGKEKHRLANVDKMDPSRRKTKAEQEKPNPVPGPSATTDPYTKYYSYLQNQVSKVAPL